MQAPNLAFPPSLLVVYLYAIPIDIQINSKIVSHSDINRVIQNDARHKVLDCKNLYLLIRTVVYRKRTRLYALPDSVGLLEQRIFEIEDGAFLRNNTQNCSREVPKYFSSEIFWW